MNGTELCKMFRRQPLKKRSWMEMAHVKSVNMSHTGERKEALHKRKQSY